VIRTGNYFEDIMPSSCVDGGDRSGQMSATGDSPCVPSMATALGKLPGAAAPKVVPGCLDTACAGTHPIDFAAVKAAAKVADAVIVAVGLCGRPKIYDVDHSDRAAIERPEQQQVNNDGTEGEGHDRISISLPDGQLALIDAVVGAVRPTTKVVLVLFNGGGLAIEKLMADNRIHAIVALPPNLVILLLYRLYS
jgi:hypothetical protein